MKNRISILATASLLMVLSASCSVLDGDTDARLKSFTETMVSDYVVASVIQLNEAAFINKTSVFKEDFKSSGKNVTITLLSAQDSLWFFSETAKNENYLVEGTIKMLPDDTQGLPCWKCNAVVSYNEGNGYTSKLTTVSPAEFYWLEVQSSTEVSHKMVFDGKFTVDTYLSDKHLDSGTVTYSQTSTGTSLSTSWQLVTYRDTE